MLQIICCQIVYLLNFADYSCFTSRCQVPKDDVYGNMLDVLTERLNEGTLTARQYNWKREFLVMKTPTSEWIVRRKLYDDYITKC